MAPIGLKLWENAFQAIPDISFFDVEKFVSKLRTAVYPLRMAPFGLKLWENAFQMIPDILCSDVEKNLLTKKFIRRQNMKCRGLSETRFPKV